MGIFQQFELARIKTFGARELLSFLGLIIVLIFSSQYMKIPEDKRKQYQTLFYLGIFAIILFFMMV